MEFFRIKRDIPFMRHALIFNVISLRHVPDRGRRARGARAAPRRRLHRRHGDGAQVRRSRRTCSQIREAVARLGFTDAAVQNFGTSTRRARSGCR